MKLFNLIFTSIAKMKVYAGNVGLYLSIVNFMLILATFKEAYNINISIFILIPIGIIGIIIVGYIDYNYIFLRQIVYTNKRNDMKTQLDRIEKRLGKVDKSD